VPGPPAKIQIRWSTPESFTVGGISLQPKDDFAIDTSDLFLSLWKDSAVIFSGDDSHRCYSLVVGAS